MSWNDLPWRRHSNRCQAVRQIVWTFSSLTSTSWLAVLENHITLIDPTAISIPPGHNSLRSDPRPRRTLLAALHIQRRTGHYTYAMQILNQSTPGKYTPGVCNIGPAEIVAASAAAGLAWGSRWPTWAVLVALHAPASLRLVVGYRQPPAPLVSSRVPCIYCAGFGMQGVLQYERNRW